MSTWHNTYEEIRGQFKRVGSLANYVYSRDHF